MSKRSLRKIAPVDKSSFDVAYRPWRLDPSYSRDGLCDYAGDCESAAVVRTSHGRRLCTEHEHGPGVVGRATHRLT